MFLRDTNYIHVLPWLSLVSARYGISFKFRILSSKSGPAVAEWGSSGVVLCPNKGELKRQVIWPFLQLNVADWPGLG